MKRYGGIGIKGECECGKVHRIPQKIIQHNSISSSLLEFNEDFKCKCGKSYGGIYDDPNIERSNFSIVGTSVLILLLLLLSFGGYKIIDTIHQNSIQPPPPTSVKDMTKKQYNDFQKWNDNQQKKKDENKKIGQ